MSQSVPVNELSTIVAMLMSIQANVVKLSISLSKKFMWNVEIYTDFIPGHSSTGQLCVHLFLKMIMLATYFESGRDF